MSSSLTLARRFCGPPDSANGGYTAGTLARYLGGAAEVTLRRPPPLDRPLRVEEDDGRVTLRDGDDLIAEADAVTFAIDVPPPVEPEVAEAASLTSPFRDFAIHPFPTCFTCGPGRAAGDGLRLFPGRVPGTDVFAAVWAPDDVQDEIVWAALDCPSGWAVDEFQREGVLLGRMAAAIHTRPEPGEAHVVIGWRVGEEGRKRFAGSAVFTGDGGLVAHSRSTWLVHATERDPAPEA